MDNLFINLIGMGNQGGTTGSISLKESTGAESNQKSFLSIFTNILSASDNQESILKKLNEIQESGEPGLAYVMSSISNMLLSMMPPEAGKAVPEGTGQEISEITGNKQDLKALESSVTQKEIMDLNSWLEQMNYSVLQGIFADTKSETTDNASTNQIAKDLEKENGTGAAIEIEQVQAFQEELIKLFSYLSSKSELAINNSKNPLPDELGKTLIQHAPVVNLQQVLLEEKQNTESELIQTHNTTVAAELSMKDILGANSVFLSATLENGGKVNQNDSSKSNNLGDNKGIDSLFKTDEKLARNTVKQSFVTEQGLDKKGDDKSEGESHALILNAVKKYKEHVPEADELQTNTDSDTESVSPQKLTNDVPQGDSFKSNILQAKDNNMTFEKGSFTSFVTDRIEKIVEQFSNRSSQMDMVVRLKLDDKETLLVGLKQEGQKVIVDVKSSNDGLVNLIQAHKDDITRHLEDKNIFTSIFVQPDGERNSERQNQQEKKKENSKQEASTSFTNILEATA
jgi:hypothetical protein